MTGITREMAAKVIAGYFNTDAIHIRGGYDTYSVRDSGDRLWSVMRDMSITCETRRGDPAGMNYSVEVVSPICRYEDIPDIQEIIRKLRGAGAKVNESCGIHVHIDGSPHTPKTLRNIVNIMASKEDLLYKALQIHVLREHFCKKANEKFLDDINRIRPKSIDRLNALWYGGSGRSYSHYDNSRYHALNLHSVFSKGTIEFRLFNSTLHAGKVKTYLQLCLAISHQALIQRGASRVRTQSGNEKYTFRTWLLRLGMIGDEFKTARKFLLENLEGGIAWKDPAQAEAQQIRLALKRQKEETASNQDSIFGRTEDPDLPDQGENCSGNEDVISSVREENHAEYENAEDRSGIFMSM
jgi:hypothetical protein